MQLTPAPIDLSALTDSALLDQTECMVRKQRREEFEARLAMIDGMIERREDIWELVTDAGASEESDIDERRWRQCDLAARVVKRYSEDAIGQFAVRANIPKNRAQEYARQGRYWSDRVWRQTFLSDIKNEVITYSHMRIAARIDDPKHAKRMLWLAARYGMSVDRLSTRVTRLKGGKPRTKRLADFTVKVGEAGAALAQTLASYDETKAIRIVVYEAQP